MAVWLGCWTLNPEVAGSSPAQTTYLELFLGGPEINSSATFVISQLVCHLPVGILNHVMFICIVCSSFVSIGPEKPYWRVFN